jgi:hypothetical protein
MSMRRATIILPAVTLAGFCLFASCTTGTIQTNNPTPPSVSWSLILTSNPIHWKVTLSGAPAGLGVNPGENYEVEFEAQEIGGIKTISIGGTGTAYCKYNLGPYTQQHPFHFSVPNQTATFKVMANQQVYTQAFLPYQFNWTSGPTAAAVAACGSNGPMFGTTTYTGTATNYSNVSASYSFAVPVQSCIVGPGC